MFDIDDPGYEEDVVNWIKDNIPELEGGDVETVETIITNVDFKGTLISIGKFNNTQVLLIGFPKEDKVRIYYPKEIKELHNDRLDRYIVDDLFWFYRERCKDIFGNNLTLCSFGMDMSMPFLCLF
jgi:hypothetical protein